MVPMAFPAIRTPASCHTPLPAWLQSPLLARNGRGLRGRACLLCLGFQTSICSATASASSTSIPR
jgi:hypothetical protein